MLYASEIRRQAIDLYKKGFFVNEISDRMHIPFGTIAGWVYATTYTGVELATLINEHTRKRAENARTKMTPGKRESQHRVREDAYGCGLRSQRTQADNFCIGLYEADGAKGRRGSSASPVWEFINSNLDYVGLMVEWAIRAGQPPADFSARVYIHEDLPVTEEEVKAYWAKAGIPVEHIRVYKVKLRANRKNRAGKPHRTPWGTCIVTSRGNQVRLFWYLRGQRDQMEESAPKRQESIELLERLRKGKAS